MVQKKNVVQGEKEKREREDNIPELKFPAFDTYLTNTLQC